MFIALVSKKKKTQVKNWRQTNTSRFSGDDGRWTYQKSIDCISWKTQTESRTYGFINARLVLNFVQSGRALVFVVNRDKWRKSEAFFLNFGTN